MGLGVRSDNQTQGNPTGERLQISAGDGYAKHLAGEYVESSGIHVYGVESMWMLLKLLKR